MPSRRPKTVYLPRAHKNASDFVTSQGVCVVPGMSARSGQRWCGWCQGKHS